MSWRYYCDFPNGQRVHVRKIADLVSYAERFGSPVSVVTMNKRGEFSAPSYYSLVDGKMKKHKGEIDATTIRC